MTKDQHKADYKSKAVTIIGIASMAWLLVCIGLFWIAAPCDVTQSGWYARKVSCLASNEMGDFLAGAFAPLAFLWLIAAVFLQRNELAAQRQELRESRAVAAQQVEEARNNVALISEQTEMLRNERLRQEQREADADINELMQTFRREAVDILQSFCVSHGKPNHENLLQARNVARFHLLTTEDQFDFLQNILRGLPGIKQFCQQVVDNNDGDLRVLTIDDITSSLPILKSIEALLSKASPPMTANFDRLRFSEQLQLWAEIIEYLKKHGKPFH